MARAVRASPGRLLAMQEVEIQPIGPAQRERVLAQTRFYIDYAESIFNKKFSPVSVEFDLAGRTAGMYKVV